MDTLQATETMKRYTNQGKSEKIFSGKEIRWKVRDTVAGKSKICRRLNRNVCFVLKSRLHEQGFCGR